MTTAPGALKTSWANSRQIAQQEGPAFMAEVLPLIEQAGLREPARA